jgi:hypothetical protein
MAIHDYTSKQVARFWSKVAKTESSEDCWIRDAPCDRDGYGYFWHKTKSKRAHRVTWEMTHGEIPADMCVCHTCDNRQCVNPAHLFLGTNEENTQDKMRKGREARGETQGNHKLTEADVTAIRERYAQGNITQKELAVEFSTHWTNISNIVRRKSWRKI